MMNSQQEPNFMLSTSFVSSQHHRPIAPIEQSTEHESSYTNADIVIAVSPTTILNGNMHVCEICYKGFQREQNLTLHRRVHNLPFELKTRDTDDELSRKVYLCPEPTCINHDPSHALGDLGGLKKHYLRKHSTDKKHKCDSCSKAYAVASDLKAHLKTCNTKKYNCECGTRFSSHSKFSDHWDYCHAKMRSNAANTSNADMMNNLLRNISNNKSTSSVGSTTSYLPSSYMGDNSSRSISNINDNSLIDSTNSYIPCTAMGRNNNNISNLITDSTMSHRPTFNMGHGSIQSNSNNNSRIGFTASHLVPEAVGLNVTRIPPNIYSLSSTQQNQHEFQETNGIGYYTNLMMDSNYNNVNPTNTSFVGDDNHYGSGEGSNLFSGSAGMMFNNSISPNLTSYPPNATVGKQHSASECFVKENLPGWSSRSSITSNMVQGFPGSSSSEIGGFGMQEEYYVPFGTPNLVANKDICGSTSRNSSVSNMVQPDAMFSSGGYIMPQEDSSLYGSEHLSIAENSGFNDILNLLNSPITVSGVGPSFINEDVRSDDHQGSYCYVDGSRHIDYGAGREVLNSGTLAAPTGEAAPYEDQYWNEHGFWN